MTILENPRFTHTDQLTGRPIVCLCGNESAEGVYFESQAFTHDESYVIYREILAEGSRLVRIHQESGERTPLTDIAIPDEIDHRGIRATIASGTDTAYYILNNRIQSIDVPSAEHTVIFDGKHLNGDMVNFPPTMNHPATHMAFAIKHASGMDLMRLDMATGREELIIRIPEGFSHPLMNPKDADCITLVRHGDACWNMDAPQIERTRTSIIDCRTKTIRPFITPPKWRTVTHESWSHDGERMFFFDKNYCEWLPVSVCSVNREGNDWQCHYTTYEHYLGHGVQSPCGNFFVADCQKSGHSPLILIDLRTNDSTIICWPNASQDGGHAACAHVHASFSPSGKYLTYTSDQSGSPRVYAVDISDITRNI